MDNRREFLKVSAGALAAMAARPLYGWQGANDRVRMGVIGMGTRAARVFDSLTRNNDCQFIVGCEVNEQKQDQLSVDVALQAGGAQLARPAPVPKAPFSPLPQRDGLLAAALGLVLGIGIALLLDVLDQSIRTKDDLTRATAPLPVLALIPAVRTWYRRDDPFVASVADPTSPAAESYRSLRTSVQLLGLSSPVRVLQVTSPSTTEGKTTTVANLAVAMADAGAAVAALDCDLRRPRSR